ncbi:hypothetical protein SAMN05216262_12524 [Colwellia chukchiensis]|uniref:Lumazine-binding n=1 Tax=Colwellia chukchiensis TaxID=641665 RepID=A0A1H7TH05_9GAMM|nr:hypothetical protein [Colwellia chukchiensis]SEL83948.1 hypothetical protein SAMN05216262_12524 [Colwellia chukchiensis]
MDKAKIEQFFQAYLVAFEQRDIAMAQRCYHMPVTLHTPDKTVLINNSEAFKHEFTDIFTVLKQAEISHFSTLKASFSQLSKHLVLACVDWQFIGPSDEVFTEFSAFYNLTLSDGQWKIFTVVSQELSQSQDLAIAFNIVNNSSDKMTSRN